MVVPSTATTSSPPRCDQGARPGDSAEHTRRNTDSSGLSPTRARAPVSAVDAGTCHPAAASARSSPAVTCRITSPYGLAGQQRAAQHEIHPQPGRQRPQPHLPRQPVPDRVINQVRRDHPGQHPDPGPGTEPAPAATAQPHDMAP